MELNLAGKVAIVTGAGRGIGRATALTLCREGAKVIIDDINLEAARLVEEEARAPRGGRTTVYGAGKGDIIAFTKNLTYELGPSGIRVNCISPGPIRTSQRAEAIESGAETRSEVLKFWQDAQALIDRAPLGRIGAPQDIANVVVFLASDASSFITGQALSVNGGTFMA